MTDLEPLAYADGDTALSGLLARPDGAPRGAVLVFPTIMNPTPAVEDKARALAAAGYLALVADFLRDSAAEVEMGRTVARLHDRLHALRDLIAVHRPDLRRGETLFPEFDAYDLRGLRHETHDRLTAQLRVAQHKLHEGTKFARLVRWRAASFLYLVTPAGLIAPAEVPEGWGLLERANDALIVVQKPCLNPTTPAERVALLERIALAGNRISSPQPT